MSKKTNNYEFISLLKSQKNALPNLTIVNANKLKNFYLIFIHDKTQFAGYGFHKSVLLNTKKRQLGYADFNIKTDLTLNSSDSHIELELNKFYAAFYKHRSKQIYPKLAPISIVQAKGVKNT